MQCFDNPARIERISAADWDFEVQDILLHSQGSGINLPEPELRYWNFKNGLGAMAQLSRDMLIAGLVLYDAWAFKGAKTLPKKEAAQLNLLPLEQATPEEVDRFLVKVSQAKL